jgi:hypothetical protein
MARVDIRRPVCYTFAWPRVVMKALLRDRRAESMVAIQANAAIETKCDVRRYRPIDIVPKFPALGFLKFELAGTTAAARGPNFSVPRCMPWGNAAASSCKQIPTLKRRMKIQSDPPSVLLMQR